MSRLFLEYSGGEAAPGPQGLGGCVCRVSRRRGLYTNFSDTNVNKF